MSVSLFLFVEKFICVIKNVLNRDRHWNFAASNTETPELGVCKKIIHMYGQLERITAWLSWKNYCLEECWYCSVTKPCPNLCDPMNCSMPGLSVLHYLPEFAQTHVHWVIDAIQPFHPLSSPSPPAFNLFQHQGFFFLVSQPFVSGGQSIGASASASVLPMNNQGWFPLGLTNLKFMSLESVIPSNHLVQL